MTSHELHGVFSLRELECLFNTSSRPYTKKTYKPRFTDPLYVCVDITMSQKRSKVESNFHVMTSSCYCLIIYIRCRSSADQIIGRPDVYPSYGDNSGSWAPQGYEDEYIEVRASLLTISILRKLGIVFSKYSLFSNVVRSYVIFPNDCDRIQWLYSVSTVDTNGLVL